jgi:hypothetical protein
MSAKKKKKARKDEGTESEEDKEQNKKSVVDKAIQDDNPLIVKHIKPV